MGLALLCGLIFGSLNTSPLNAQGADCTNYTYTIQPGDYLAKIARKLGNASKWRVLHDFNRDEIGDPNLIYPGQSLLIPPIFFDDICKAEDNEPVEIATIEVEAVEEIIAIRKEKRANVDSLRKQEQLTQLRELVAEIASNQKKKQKEEPEPTPGLEINGLIIDETRSKMGKDFFDVFYQTWVAPENARNFTITIQERPMPSLGTIVNVKVNDRNTFQTRLQPKYELIQQYGRQAVLYTHQYLKQQPTLKIY